MSRVGFEQTISAFERVKTVHALDHAANVIGIRSFRTVLYLPFHFLIYINNIYINFLEVDGNEVLTAVVMMCSLF
jgi:hypothetical protein